MKKICLLVLIFTLLLAGCGNPEVPKPDLSQMQNICELATLECYYHNVAKYDEKDAKKFLWMSKDKKFWVEYSGTVRLGIDASRMEVDVRDDVVTIALPPVMILSSKVDSDTLNEDSFIVAVDSAEVTAEDQTYAFQNAEADMLKAVSHNGPLILNAQNRVKTLLTDYVENLGKFVGQQYQIQWTELEEEPASPADADPSSDK